MIRIVGTGALFLIVGLSGCSHDGVSGLPIKSPIDKSETDPSAPTITIVAGDNSTALAGQPVQLMAVVKSPSGELLAKDTVTWSVVSGGGRFSAGKTVTDAAGFTMVDWTLGIVVGTQESQASVSYRQQNGSGGLAATSRRITATARPVPPPTVSTIALHFDGTTWSTSLPVEHPAPCCAVVLNSIWGSSDSNVFAGGGSCSAFIARYDGSAWHDLPSCSGGGTESILSIWGTSDFDVFAIRRYAYPPNVTSTIRHYDGQAWSTSYERSCSLMTNPTCTHLRAVWSRSATDAFAVGGLGTILHYDGTSWTGQASGTTANLNAVWGDRATGEVFAVGDNGTVLTYDGNAWHPQTSGSAKGLTAIWGTSFHNVFAVGGAGTVIHFDGTSWAAQNSGTTNTLLGVWGNADNSAFAVGEGGTIARYNGTSWTTQTVSGLAVVNAVWGTSATNVFAVGVGN